MKKALSLLLAAAVLLSAFPAAWAASPADKEWLVLLYICGSDLESDGGQASEDIREMVSSGIASSSDVSVIIATGGSRDWQEYGISSRNVQYFRLGVNGPELLKDAGRQNMGSASTLSGFIRFGLSVSPAQRTMLVIWDHGGGPVFGLCNDENYSGDALTLAELHSGLTAGLNGTVLDIIGFDCCLMSCVDLCTDLRGIADYAVLSQEMVSGTGFDYDAWMGLLAADPGLSAEKLAVSVAETYVADNSRGRWADTATMSVIRTEGMTRVAEAADNFSAALSKMLDTNLAGVIRLRTRLLSFGEFIDEDATDLVDVEEMCTVFSALLPDECAELLDAAGEAVVFNCTTDDISSHAHGLSFFLPYDTLRWDRAEILEHYSGQSGAYSGLAVALASQSSSGYSMSASSYTPSGFYFYDEEDGCSGSFCDIWDGYYGEYLCADDVCGSSGGNIWSGLSPSGGSVWSSPSASGIWGGFGGGTSSAVTAAPTHAAGSIWSGLNQAGTASPSPAPAAGSASPALNNIWQGLLNTGSDYYQPGETNENVQPGISEAVSAGEVLEEANTYFSSAVLSSQMIYSLQLNKEDLDHLASAVGVLSKKEGDEVIRLGNLGQTTIDWSTGLIFSMFDGSWPTLGGVMVRAEFLYADEQGNTRFVIPARVNGLRMYLLGVRREDGTSALLGATQGYDENGIAIRGMIPLEEGMTVCPLFTAVSRDGTGREFEGTALVIPSGGLSLDWDRIPEGDYLYCFALTDLGGQVHDTSSVPLSF